MQQIAVRTRLSTVFLILGAIAIGIFWGLRIQRESLNASTVSEHRKKLTLRVLSYPGLLSEKLLDDFKNRYEIDVSVHIEENPEKLWEHFESSVTIEPEDFDLVTFFSYQIPLAAQLDRLHPLDEGLLKNISSVAPDFRDIPGETAFREAVPVLWGLVGFAQPQDLKKPSYTWIDALKQASAKNKTGFPSSTTLFWHLSEISRSSKDLTKSVNSLLSHSVLTPDFLSAKALLKEEDKNTPSLIVVNHGEMAFEPLRSSHRKFVLPEDGAFFWTLSIAIHPRMKNSEAAYTFLDFVLEREAAIELAGSYQQASTNRTLEPVNLDPRLKPSYFRDVSLSHLNMQRDFNRARELREILDKLKGSAQ